MDGNGTDASEGDKDLEYVDKYKKQIRKQYTVFGQITDIYAC